MYQDDERSLEKVWQRLGLESSPQVNAERQQAALRPVQVETQSLARARRRILGRNSQMRQEAQSSNTRNLSLIAATLVAALIVGSMLWVFNLSHYNTGPASYRNIQQRPTAKPDLPPGLYISDKDSLFRLDPQTRKVLWQLSLKIVIKIVPVGNIVYVLQSRGAYASSTVPNTVYAIDANTGSIRWSHTFTDHQLDPGTETLTTDLVFSDGLLYDGLLYVSIQTLGTSIATYTARVYVLNALDGKQLGAHKQLWSRDVHGGVQQTPIVSNGAVYIATDGGENLGGENFPAHVVALTAGKGDILWQQQLDGSITDNLCVSHGVVYVSSDSALTSATAVSGTYALNAQNGSKLWKDTQHIALRLVPTD